MIPTLGHQWKSDSLDKRRVVVYSQQGFTGLQSAHRLNVRWRRLTFYLEGEMMLSLFVMTVFMSHTSYLPQTHGTESVSLFSCDVNPRVLYRDFWESERALAPFLTAKGVFFFFFALLFFVKWKFSYCCISADINSNTDVSYQTVLGSIIWILMAQ